MSNIIIETLRQGLDYYYNNGVLYDINFKGGYLYIGVLQNININFIITLLYVVVEVGFSRDNYSVSEQPTLRDVTICVQINNGTLERAVDINFNVRDITAQSMCCEHFPVINYFVY